VDERIGARPDEAFFTSVGAAAYRREAEALLAR
jgi:hypothetical protein